MSLFLIKYLFSGKYLAGYLIFNFLFFPKGSSSVNHRL